MKVLLSIKPEFVEQIFAGTKKYEFRKSMFKRDDVKSVIIYASSPVRKIVGEFEIAGILSSDIDLIWDITKEYSGISRTYYDSYFQERKIANAVQIGRITKFEQPKNLSDYNINKAPRSFCYISE